MMNAARKRVADSIGHGSSLPHGPLGDLLGRLAGVQPKGSYWIARCPAHDDRTASLSVSVGRDGKVLTKCHAGCTFDAIVRSAGMQPSQLFAPRADRAPSNGGNGHGRGNGLTLVDQYTYTDAHGEPLFQTRRYVPKTFRQFRYAADGTWIAGLGDVEPVLFNLPAVIEAVALGKRIYIVEGEKDAQTLINRGHVATTSPMGAGKWRDSMAEALTRAPDVVIMPDNDDAGRNHAKLIANSLAAYGATAHVVQLPRLQEKQDVTDWFDAGGTDAELELVIQRERRASRRSWRLDEVLADPELMRPPEAVVPRLVWTGRSTLFSASLKAGKSTLIGFLAMQVSTGGRFLGAACLCGNVLIAGLEESLGDLARRLQHFGADHRRVHLIDHVNGTTDERIGHILEVAARVEPVLVVVDTLVAYGMGVVQDENSAAQMQPLVQGLSNAAHQNEFGLFIAHHNNKGGGFRGSSAIGGGVDVLAEMTRPEDQRDSLRTVKLQGRFPVSDFEMRFGGGEFVLANADGASLIQRILDFVRVSPRTSLRAIRESIGGRASVIDDAIRHLEEQRFIRDEGGEGRCQYVASATAPTYVTMPSGGDPASASEPRVPSD
jgi:5S rRNA maturation endonuclease (ribonuclease M5)